MQINCSNIVKNILLTVKASIILMTFYNVNTLANSAIDALAGQCVACHGKNGVSLNDSWPNLAGQKPGYLIKEITAFRDGSRQNALMSPMVKGLTDNEIQALAKYFSSKVNVSKQNANENIKGKHVRARCISCHGMDGFTVNDLWPNLAGQKKSYLESQLLAFKNGQRKSPIMEVIAKELNKKQIADVAEYFSQQAASEQ